MPPSSEWRRSDAYPPLLRLLVAHARASDPIPSPARVRKALGIPPATWDSWQYHRGDGPPPRLTLEHAVRIARYVDRPVAEVLVVAGLCPADDPLYDADGAWELVLTRIAATYANDEARRDMLLAALEHARAATHTTDAIDATGEDVRVGAAVVPSGD